jgi:MFS family permease
MHKETGNISITTTTDHDARGKRLGYENRLALIGFLIFGCLILDRNAMYYVGPFVVKEFHFSSTAAGTVVGALSLGYALFGLLAGPFADRHGRRKVMIFGVLTFSVMSGITAVVRNFGQLIAARALMGTSEGVATTTISAIVSTQSTPRRLGLNMAIVFSSSTLVGFVIAPVLMTRLAAGVGWRWAFALAGVPGFLVAILAWRFIAENRPTRSSLDRHPKPAPSKFWPQLGDVLRVRNVQISLVVALLAGLWISSTGTFVPLYLTTTRYHLDPRVMGMVVAAGGVGGFAGQLLMGRLSDRRGRRKVILASLALLTCYAWCVPVIGPNVLPLAAALFVFSFGQVAIALAVATVPSESVPGHLAATAVAVPVFGVEIGAFIGPIFVGVMADATGNPAMPLWLGGIATAIALLVALGYRETVDRVRSASVS